jgi:rhodanese-related sulfurtransferase
MSLRGSLRGLFVRPHQQVQAVEARGRTGGGATLLDVRKSNEWEDGHVQAPGTCPWGSWASGREAARQSAGHHVCCSGAWSACAGSLLAGQGRDVVNLRRNACMGRQRPAGCRQGRSPFAWAYFGHT